MARDGSLLEISAGDVYESELNKYEQLLRDCRDGITEGNVINFWLEKRQITGCSNSSQALSHIASLAVDLCASPASEAYCERIFSLCGDLCAGKRNRTTKLLELKVFLKLNQKFLDKLS